MVVNDNARCQPLIYTIADIRYQNSVQSQQNLQKLPVITVCGRHRTNLEHEHIFILTSSNATKCVPRIGFAKQWACLGSRLSSWVNQLTIR